MARINVDPKQWTQISAVECDFQNLGEYKLLFTAGTAAPNDESGFELHKGQLEHFTPPLNGKLFCYNPNYDSQQVEVLVGNAFK